MYQPGQAVVLEFCTNSSSGAAANADSLPTAAVSRNGVTDSLVPVVANIDIGHYRVSFTIPSGWVAGDSLSVTASATIGGIATRDVLVNAPLSAATSGGTDAATLIAALLATVIPNTNPAGTVADCLNAARAQGFGRWTLNGSTLSLYGADGVTVVRSFTIDSSTAPTSRL